jgi:hypothetical protein
MSVNEFPVIVILDGELATKQWTLDKERMTLGREDTCDIFIPQRQISRQHVTFIRENPERYWIEDHESKNGTWVNGNRLEGMRPLSDGDEIHIALTVRIRFIGSGITAPVTQNLPDVIPTGKPKAPDDDRYFRLRIDQQTRRVYISNVEVDPPFSLPQYRLLELLYYSNGKVCTREDVVNYVWPDVSGDGVSEQAIDALIRRLRDRLTELDPEHQYINTVRGHGFRFEQGQL